VLLQPIDFRSKSTHHFVVVVVDFASTFGDKIQDKVQIYDFSDTNNGSEGD
jgi:hypothetical protein